LSLQDIVNVARQDTFVQIDKKANKRIEASHAILKTYLDAQLPVYGMSTQFGDQVDLIDKRNRSQNYKQRIEDRQRRLIISHNIGLGDPVQEEVTRAAMLLRAHCLAHGFSGVRFQIPQALVALVNNKIHPRIRRYGSIGASGDLIPLSAVGAVLIGESVSVMYKGKVTKGPRILWGFMQ